MRFANGTGSITKLKGKRRKPYWVRAAKEAYVEDGKLKYKRETIGYYRTHKEALIALGVYDDNPYSLEKLTFRKVWERAKPRLKTKDEKRIKAYDSVLDRYLSNIADMNIKEIRTCHMEDAFDDCDKGSGTKKRMKTILNTTYDYAMSNDIVLKNYADFVLVKEDEDEEHLERIVFAPEEIKKIWDRSDEWEYAFMLILLYTGCRFSEIANNTIDSIDFENESLYIPLKCAKNPQSVRTIPLHKDIIDVIKHNLGTTYLFEKQGNKVRYNNMYNRQLPKINKYLGQEHTFHDTRHTFTTRLKELKVDTFFIDELVGHKHKNITEDVYTHATVDMLREYMSVLTYF